MLVTTEYAEAVAQLFGIDPEDRDHIEDLRLDLLDRVPEKLLEEFSAASRFVEGMASDAGGLSLALELALGHTNVRLREAVRITKEYTR
jgi:hypothetical protein